MKRHHSLVVRLAGLSTLIIMLTVLVLSAVVYYGFQTKIKQQVQQNLSAIAQAEANKIASIIEFERVNLFSWRTSAVMMDTIVDDLDKRIQTQLINLKKNYQLAGDLYVFNQQEKLIASSTPNLLGQGLPENWQLKNQDYQFIPAHNIKFANHAEPIAAFVINLAQTGKPQQGTLVLTQPWQELWQHLNKNTDYQFAFYHHNPHHLDLITEQGIVHQVVTKEFTQQKTWSVNQQTYLGALSKSQAIGEQFVLQIAAFISENKANEPQIELLKQLNIAACLVILPIMLIAIALSHRFIAPIKTLTNTIHQIEISNDLSLSLTVKGKDEVADLANAFNRMMGNLSQSFYEHESISKEVEYLNQNLEHKVKARTHELATALDQLKTTQLQLVQSEKMTSLGQLVAGVAHEINNPIGAIYANVQPLKDYVDDLQEALALAQTLLKDDALNQFESLLTDIDYDFLQADLTNLLTSQQQAADRIKKIVLSLRNFSRLDQGDIKSVQLEEGIDSTLQILHHEYKGRIKLEKDYQLNQIVECYASELNQVFMNILANAIQAIPEKGHICVSTYLEKQAQQSWAVIKIADDGAGIPDDVKSRIFEPFFTTKEIGKGTGLGLSISYGIIEKHKGTLSVDSIANQGTTFIIHLPLSLTTS